MVRQNTAQKRPTRLAGPLSSKLRLDPYPTMDALHLLVEFFQERELLTLPIQTQRD